MQEVRGSSPRATTRSYADLRAVTSSRDGSGLRWGSAVAHQGDAPHVTRSALHRSADCSLRRLPCACTGATIPRPSPDRQERRRTPVLRPTGRVPRRCRGGINDGTETPALLRRAAEEEHFGRAAKPSQGSPAHAEPPDPVARARAGRRALRAREASRAPDGGGPHPPRQRMADARGGRPKPQQLATPGPRAGRTSQQGHPRPSRAAARGPTAG